MADDSALEAVTATGAIPTKAHAGRGHATHRPWYRRLRVVGGGAGALTAIAIGVAFAVTSGGEPEALAPSVTPSASPSPSTAPLPSPTDNSVIDAASVATVAVEELPVYARAGDAKPAKTLSKFTYYAQPLTMLPLERTVLDGDAWLRVKLPIQPNGSTGWVRESDVTITETTTEIRIYLDKKVLEFYVDGERKLKGSIVIGKPGTPTPTGTYFVSDLLDLRANPKGVYGAYALGLSGYSEVLKSFNDGPPQIAIHGTNEPWLRGYAESNGCIRLPNEDILKIVKWVERGTPVHIYEEKPPKDDAEEADAATDGES